MYTRDEIAELIYNGEMVAFANSDGGRIILGVDDGGGVVGLQRFAQPKQLEEWVMHIARDALW